MSNKTQTSNYPARILDIKIQLTKSWFLRVFSQTVEYALRAMIHLATAAPAARTTDQIAVATQVPRACLSRV
ncbi:MAG: hypothetical protein ACKON9_01800, partial [Planctomycetaceae bacterium]